MRNRKFISDAKAFVRENFAGVDGFNNNYNFAGDFEMAGGYETAGVNLHQYNSTSSQPYEITVDNANLVETSATVFNSYVNRTAGNNGNVAGITVASAISTVTYTGLLSQTEHKNFECGLVYVQTISGSNAVLTRPITLTTSDGNGSQDVVILNPKKNPMQNQTDVLEFYHTFKINGYTNWVVSIPSSTKVQYSFYPSATVDTGRTLGAVPALRDYKAPVISKPTQITLSPKAAQALGMR